ncbi:ATP-binding protein [Sphingosinicella sp. BN140058]|uniref:sensor histidine kinase n=1 Tax=Sphingosinicella sp. BN140058 TaxID=1892855 RepID=UPI0010124A17|nr:sensor histidine kinase [Sphingosinicella sp. BN140058]QAY76032.1 histidine kinase [Sphingosinicella sp. BN140058]
MPLVPENAERGVARVLAPMLALGFAALLLAAAAAAWLQGRNQDNAAAVEHTLLVDAKISDFATLVERAETGRRGYLLSGDQAFRTIFVRASAGLPALAEDIAKVTADNPRQQARAERLRALLRRQQLLQTQTIQQVSAGRTADFANFNKDPGVALTRQIRAIAQTMRGDERALLRLRNERQRATLATFYTVLTVAGLLLILVAAVTLATMRRYTGQLTASRNELRRLNGDLEVLVQERTSELQRANQEIQRFAYIVSHDLRSPLVNVMGFTAELDAARQTIGGWIEKVEEEQPDLVPQDTRLAVREDLPEAIGFIRTSTQKMDRLINAILRLSREGRRALTPEPLDMNALVQGIIDNLHQRAADAGAEISAGPLPDVVSDRVAIDQILSNLVENAVKYLKPGRPGIVRIGGHREGARVVFEVSDNGRGIDPRDHERIFDLFRRSGAQDQPGEGIGLAHVRALAYRLGGVIDVRSQLDHGATFRLSVPIKLEAGTIAA